jgi:hypothetical protein
VKQSFTPPPAVPCFLSAGGIVPRLEAARVRKRRQACASRLRTLVKPRRHTKDSVNGILRNLYHVIPHKMTNTRKYFLRDNYRETFLIELLQSEQNLLDTFESQSKVAKLTLDTFGLDISVESKAGRDLIAEKTDFKVSGQRIFKVTNRATEAAFQKGKKTKLLYHGSRNGNWMAVLQKGLRIRLREYRQPGRCSENAIYFAIAIPILCPCARRSFT